MRISDDEARALAFIAALIGLTVLGRWVDRPRAVLPDAEVDIASLMMRSETALARAKGGSGGRAAGARAGGAPKRPAGAGPAARPIPFGPASAGRERQADRTAAQAAAAPIDLNHATAQELERLPGVGPALALRIVARRDSAGPFRTLEQLDSVRGVGPSLLARIKPLLRLAR